MDTNQNRRQEMNRAELVNEVTGSDLLREGQVVEFEIEEGPKDPRAIKVRLSEKAEVRTIYS